MLYTVAHPVSKCNMMYILRYNLPYLTTVRALGVPKPKECVPDELGYQLGLGKSTLPLKYTFR